MKESSKGENVKVKGRKDKGLRKNLEDSKRTEENKRVQRGDLVIYKNRTEEKRTEENRTEQSKTEQDRTEQHRTEQRRSERKRT